MKNFDEMKLSKNFFLLYFHMKNCTKHKHQHDKPHNFHMGKIKLNLINLLKPYENFHL